MARLEPAPAGSKVAEQGEGPWREPPAAAQLFTVRGGAEKTAPNAAWQMPDAPEDHRDLAGRVAFAWQAMDAWFEEDWQIRVHPHVPYHLIDVLPSSRHVRVVSAGVTVAETRRPVLVF